MDNRNEVFSDKVDLNKGGVFTSQPNETMTGSNTVQPQDSVAPTPDNAVLAEDMTQVQDNTVPAQENMTPAPGNTVSEANTDAGREMQSGSAPIPYPVPDYGSAGPVPNPYPTRNYGPAGSAPNPNAAPNYGPTGPAPNPNMSPDYGYGSQGYTYGEGFYQYPEQGGYEREMEVPVSIGDWLISMLLMLIPCVNIILMLVWGFSDKEKRSKSNYFKARLIFCGIEIGLIFVWFIFYGFMTILML